MRVLFPTDTPVSEPDDSELARLLAYPDRQRWVRAVMIATLDGAAYGADGHSRSISGPADRRLLALSRAMADVILVGAETARAERYGPPVVRRPGHARIRQELGLGDPPPIAVVSTSLELPDRLLTDERTVVLTTEQSPADRRAELATRVDVVVAGSRSLDLVHALDALADRGHTRISCEGGPRLYADMLAAGLVDDHLLAYSPVLVAGSGGRITDGPALGHPAVVRLAALLEEDGFLFSRWVS